MSHIHIERTHTLGFAAARAAADRVAAELQREHGVRPHWEGDTLKVHKTGLRGELVVSDNRVIVNVKLGLRMRLFRSTLEKEINERLDVHLTMGAQSERNPPEAFPVSITNPHAHRT